ncbi:MAG: CDP-diacylglycerol--serine O-phosphatidyltransferase [Bacteroidales bacterium]|nr:CDP-diacylglycerol--serine O-phosphatidyltransferase [Bacteroidales bacterium]
MSLKKYIPDFITSLGLASGVLGVVFALEGKIWLAFPLMLAAAVFDFCDGLAARALDAYSELGKELDSLSDMVSFGVLPSVMLYNLMKTCSFSSSAWCLVPLLLAVFSGLRLAKFNVDPRQHMSFVGLPTPVAALLCGSLCWFVAHEPASLLATLSGGLVFVPVLTVVLCALLVCEIPMFSMKIAAGDTKTVLLKRISFIVEIAVIVAVVLLLRHDWSLAVVISCVLYILKNLVYAVFKV